MRFYVGRRVGDYGVGVGVRMPNVLRNGALLGLAGWAGFALGERFPILSDVLLILLGLFLLQAGFPVFGWLFVAVPALSLACTIVEGLRKTEAGQ